MAKPLPGKATEQTVDTKADAIVDLAAANFDRHLSLSDRDDLCEKIQDAVAALIDECRDYYRGFGEKPE